MPRRIVRILAAVILVLCICLNAIPAHAWGPAGHALVTRKAAAVLPDAMRPFFAAHLKELEEHSDDPDEWRQTDKDEGPRHFLDMDYEGFGKYPFVELPRDYTAAKEKFGEETLRKYGLLPWVIDDFTQRTADAMRSGDAEQIIVNAAALSHYVADGHMPLHAVLNYNGQFTNQRGVHGRWEHDMVNRNLAALDELTAADATQARPVESPVDAAFEMLLDSYACHFLLLNHDRRAATGISGDLRENDAYYARLWQLSKRLCAERLSDAGTLLAGYWMAAWERAGKPAMPLSTAKP